MNLIKIINSYLRAYYPKLGIAAVLSCIGSVAIALTPLISSNLIDDVLSSTTSTKIAWTIGTFIVVCLAQPVIDYIRSRLLIRCTEGIVHDLRKEIFFHYLDANVVDFKDHFNLTTLLTNDVRLYSDFLTACLCTVTKDILLFILILVGMFVQSLSISILLLGLLFLYAVLNHFASKTYETLSSKTLNNYDKLCEVSNVCDTSRMPLKIYNQTNWLTEKFNEVIINSFRLNVDILTRGSLINSASSSIVVLSLALIYTVGALKVLDGEMSVGQVVALGLFFQLLASPFQSINNFIGQYRKAKPAARRIAKVLMFNSEDIDNVTLIQASQPSLELRNVTVAYETSNEANYRSISFNTTFTGNGIHLIKGKSGSGKSTMFNVLANLYPIESGRIQAALFDTVEYKIAYEQQIPLFVPGLSLNENLFLDAECNDKNMHKLHCLLSTLRLDDFTSFLPNGLDTQVNDSFKPSGGETKRLALIRAIISGRKILLLDEITAGLDAANIDLIKQCLSSYAQSHMILIATHDSVFDDVATSIYTLDA